MSLQIKNGRKISPVILGLFAPVADVAAGRSVRIGASFIITLKMGQQLRTAKNVETTRKIDIRHSNLLWSGRPLRRLRPPDCLYTTTKREKMQGVDLDVIRLNKISGNFYDLIR